MQDSSRSLLPPVNVVLIEQLLRLLSAGQRLEILRLLSDRPHYVNELADGLFQSCGAVSRDLAELRRSGLVHRENDGLRRMYQLTNRVNVKRDAQASQISVTTSNGDWILAHAHRAINDLELIAPPSSIVGDRAFPRLHPIAMETGAA